MSIVLVMFINLSNPVIDYEHLEQNIISVTATAYTQSRAEGTEDGITASNTKVKEGRTIAVSRDLVKRFGYGGKVSLYVDEVSSDTFVGEFIIEDCMAKKYKNRVDVFHKSYKDAMNFGKKKAILLFD